MTPEERASAITEGWRSIEVEIVWTGPPSMRPPGGTMHVGGHMVHVATQLIADAIRAAVAEERGACAVLVDARAAAIEADLPAWECYLGERVRREKEIDANDLRRLAAAMRERGAV